MCLDKVTKREVVLKKDLIVKKIVGIRKNNNLYFGELTDKRIQVKKGINKAVIKQIKYNHYYYNSGYHCYYNSGYHCYLKKYWYKNEFRVIRTFIIPKGTKVLYGKQNGLTVIVTPILIYKEK